jgi:hypothetical protein
MWIMATLCCLSPSEVELQHYQRLEMSPLLQIPVTLSEADLRDYKCVETNQHWSFFR